MSWMTGRDLRSNDSPADLKGSMRERVDLAVRRIQMQITTLDSTSSRLAQKDQKMFDQVQSALKSHDPSKATVIANELVQIRGMARMVKQSKLAFEQIMIRLNTLRDLGDVVVTLQPAISVIRSIKPHVAATIPEAEGGISELSGLLNSIMAEASPGPSTSNIDTSGDVAEDILTEASAVAEKWAKDRFPEIPTEVVNVPQKQVNESMA